MISSPQITPTEWISEFRTVQQIPVGWPHISKISSGRRLVSHSPEDALFTMSLSYCIAQSCHRLFNIVNTGNWKPAILFVFKASKDAQRYVN